MNNVYKIGPLNVSLIGSSKILTLLKDEFDNYNQCGDDVDLEIEIIDSGKSAYSPSHFSGKGSMNFNSTTYYVDYDHFYSYEVSNLFETGKVTVKLFLKQSSLKSELFRLAKSLLSVEYNSRNAFIKNLLATYSFLWGIAAICLFKKNCTFIHAGILSKNQNAIVLSGTGGCGKTSTVLHLLSFYDFEYLSEDFGIVCSNGVAYPCSKTVSLYYSDIIHNNPSALNAVKSLSLEKKLRWHILTRLLNLNPIIKAKPNSLAQTRISEKPVSIKYGVHFSRQNTEKFKLNKIPLDEYAIRSANASGRELKLMSEIFKLINANAPSHYPYWDDARLMEKLEISYQAAFKNLETYEFIIPYKSAPKEVCDYLLSELVL